MKKQINYLGAIIAIMSLIACSPVEKKSISKELSQQIDSDQRIAQVEKMAEALVNTGFTAGDGYGEVWIRDLNSFVELSAKVNGKEKTKEALLTFFKFQEDDGNIPDGYITKSISSGGYDYKLSDLSPEYMSHKNTVETDQETSLIQAVSKYIEATGDKDFLKEMVGNKTVEDRMHDALQYLLNDRFNEKYGLLWGATTVDWGDVQPEHEWGVEMDRSSHPAIDVYDNAMFVIAINNYISLIDDKDKIEYWKEAGKNITDNVRKHLWDAENQKYIPHIYLEKGSPFPADFDENQIYYHGGTFMAIEAGFLTKEEIETSYNKMLSNVKASGAPSIGLTVYPPYPNGMFLNTGLHEYGYQNGGDWTWFGGRMIQQLIKHEMYDEAYESMIPMLDLVIKHNGFYEWWALDGSPKGSASFRGAAGVLWKSIQMLKEKTNEAEQI